MQAGCGTISITGIDPPSRKEGVPQTLCAFPQTGLHVSPSLCYGVVEGVATMMPARKKVSAADNRQKGQNACSMNACT